MDFLIAIPFIIQAIVIGLDEYYFHIKRGLPLWERIGHPLDTLSFLACLAFVLLVPYSHETLKWYIGMGLLSCLMVTKDEWIHKHHCPAAEQWLHALLFLNHPIVLGAIGMIWWAESLPSLLIPEWMGPLLSSPSLLKKLLVGQTAFTFMFFIYQIYYWNFRWKEKQKTR